MVNFTNKDRVLSETIMAVWLARPIVVLELTPNVSRLGRPQARSDSSCWYFGLDSMNPACRLCEFIALETELFAFLILIHKQRKYPRFMIVEPRRLGC